MHDLVVIGGGPAGLTATMYAVQKRLDVILVTRDLGGKTNYHLQLPFVERHMVINGDEMVNRFAREIEYLDFMRKLENAESVSQIPGGYRVETSKGDILDTKAVIIATGAKAQLLNVPGEREFMMRGLCYSAVSYAQLFIDRSVAVVGCGDLALRAVAELAQVAQGVTLIAEDCDEFDTPLGQKVTGLTQVDILHGYAVKEVKGDTYARSVVVMGPEGDKEIDIDAVFVELDLTPRSRIVADLVELDDKTRIKIDAMGRTNAPGIFAAGDVTDSYAEQVLIAMGDGAKAALTAYEYLLALEAEAPAAV